jgi:C-terminal processing protease CtpA/Prc
MSSNEQLLGDVQTLKEFLSTAGRLTLDDQKAIVEMATIVLEEAYVHLPLKIAMHAVNPLRKLRILQNHLEESGPDAMNQELDFHKEMLDIFTSLRDLHTNYVLAEPFSNRFAILPFLVESYVKDSQQPTDIQRQRDRQFLVTQVGILDRFKQWLPANFELHFPATFKPGVEITYWNGVPMQRAVNINANKKAGSNSAARFARGLENMTIRPMRSSLPPDEEWVVIGYRTEDGQDLEYRLEWLVVSPKPVSIAIQANSDTSEYSYKIGMDLTTDLVRKMKQIMFAPTHVIDSERRLAAAESVEDLVKKAEGLMSVIPSVFRAEKISEDVGYIRIYTFSGDRPSTISHDQWVDQMVEEFRRLIMELPKKGLIIDVRDNGGGYINFAERLLQFLTPQEITPEPYSFVSSPLTLEVTRDISDPGQKFWHSSISESLSTGSIFSGGYPLTDKDEANRVGQLYHGPVILVTNALCYSATDLFAAGFQDHQIGSVLGVDGNTGAGGANVWEYELLRRVLAGSRYKLNVFPNTSQGEPFSPFRVSIRRNVRIGERAGTPIEDLGIKPDIRYNMTREDLLNRNVDLIKRASEILASKPVRQLEAVISDRTGSLEIELASLGISRVDVYVDSRPVLSQDVTDGTNKLSIGNPSTGARLLKIIGLKENEVVAARKVFL